MDPRVQKWSRGRISSRMKLGSICEGKVLVLLFISQQSSFAGIFHRFEAVVQLQLFENIMDVIFYRLRFDGELQANCLVQP